MPRSVSYVSTCSRDGWAEYGERFVASFIKYFPPSVKLYFYIDFKPTIRNHRVIYRHPDECTGLSDFHSNIARMPFARGDELVHDLHNQCHNPHIIWNARKFSFKVFTVEHAVLNNESDAVFWLDADSIAFRPIDDQLISNTLPPHCMVSYLGRADKYSECGYIGYNMHHPMTSVFARFVADLYRSGTVFSFKEWHDSYVWDIVRVMFERHYGVTNFNISWREMNADHVFINCILGDYLDHMKGPRKSEGKSNEADLIFTRDPGYWKSAS